MNFEPMKKLFSSLLEALIKAFGQAGTALKSLGKSKSKPIQFIVQQIQFIGKKVNFHKQSVRKQYGLVGAGILIGFFLLWIVMRIGGLVLFSTCSYVLESGSGQSFAKRLKPAAVEAYKVSLGTISKRIQTVGRLRPSEIVTLKSEMPGRITDMPFKQGSEVKKGDLLIQFDDADAKAELKEAESRLIQAKADFGRISELKSRGTESGKKYDEVTAALGICEAKVASAQSKLEKTQIKAPFGGTAGIVELSVGAYVQQAQELVTIVDNNPMKIDFRVPEKNIHDIGTGQAAEIKLDGFPDQIFTATVEAIDSKVDGQSHSIAVRGTIPNPQGLLRGGLFANISLIIGEKGDAILIPESSIEREGDIEYVWLVKNNKTSRKRVLTGTKENGKVEIVAGVNSGEIVVTTGQNRLSSDGHPVHMLNLNEDGSEKPKEEQKKLEDVEEAE